MEDKRPDLDKDDMNDNDIDSKYIPKCQYCKCNEPKVPQNINDVKGLELIEE